MAVVVDQVGAVRAVGVQLKPDAAGPCGAQTDVVLEDLRPGELGDHFRASLHDRRGVGRVRGRVTFAGFGGAAEDAVAGAGVDVGVGKGTRRGGGAVAQRLTAKDAYLEGKLSLPPGYGLEHGADVLLLRRGGRVGGGHVQRRGCGPG